MKNSELISHIEVFEEIKKGKQDTIHEWCKDHKDMFKDIDECQEEEIKNVEKKYNSQYWRNEINKDGPWADPWLIALSICEKATIVTDEKNSQNHILYIAELFKVPCVNLLCFFKEIGINY